MAINGQVQSRTIVDGRSVQSLGAWRCGCSRTAGSVTPLRPAGECAGAAEKATDFGQPRRSCAFGGATGGARGPDGLRFGARSPGIPGIPKPLENLAYLAAPRRPLPDARLFRAYAQVGGRSSATGPITGVRGRCGCTGPAAGVTAGGPSRRTADASAGLHSGGATVMCRCAGARPSKPPPPRRAASPPRGNRGWHRGAGARSVPPPDAPPLVPVPVTPTGTHPPTRDFPSECPPGRGPGRRTRPAPRVPARRSTGRPGVTGGTGATYRPGCVNRRTNPRGCARAGGGRAMHAPLAEGPGGAVERSCNPVSVPAARPQHG